VNVIVDTTVWSLALRRRREQLSSSEQDLVVEWENLAASDRAVLVGPIRQEVLSGIRDEKVFTALQARLSHFRSLEILPGDYDQADCLEDAAGRRRSQRSPHLRGSPGSAVPHGG